MLPSPSQSAVTAATAGSGVSAVGVTSATRPSNRSAVEALEARALGPGHRMPADEAHTRPRRARARRLHHAALHAAGVGQDGPGREMRPRGANELRQRPHRRAEDDQARARDARREVGGAAIGRPRVEHRPDGGLVARHHDDLAGEPPGPDAAGDRAADEAGADDGQAGPAGRLHARAPPLPSTARSPSISRALSSGVPTVIRSARVRPKLAIGRTMTPRFRSSS